MSVGDSDGIYFVDTKRFRDSGIARVVPLMLGVVGGSIVFWTFVGTIVLGGGWTNLWAWVYVLFGAVLVGGSVEFWRLELTTVVRSDGVYQLLQPRTAGFTSYEGQLVPADEITETYVVDNGDLDGGIRPETLPDRTQRWMTTHNLSGVYVRTTGDPPPFRGIIGGSMSIKVTKVPGFLVTDRPDELSEAIERVR